MGHYLFIYSIGIGWNLHCKYPVFSVAKRKEAIHVPLAGLGRFALIYLTCTIIVFIFPSTLLKMLRWVFPLLVCVNWSKYILYLEWRVGSINHNYNLPFYFDWQRCALQNLNVKLLSSLHMSSKLDHSQWNQSGYHCLWDHIGKQHVTFHCRSLIPWQSQSSLLIM
jgi:hypothetical protein